MKSTLLNRVIIGVVLFTMVFALVACRDSKSNQSKDSAVTAQATGTVATTQSTANEVKKAPTINVGDHVQFGKYNGEPILWKCINKDDKGVMLVSQYIISTKAFDAAESGNVDKGKDDVEKYGLNTWANSNLREWLNSSDTKVNYTTKPPIKSAVLNGLNAYADEPGFLSNFTTEERDKIKAVNHDGVDDLVYILNQDELDMYVGMIKELVQREITNTAKQKSESQIEGNNWWYWTRSTTSPGTTYERDVYIDGNITYYSPCDGNGGIVPALNLKSDAFKSGRGTIDEPYILN